MLNKNIIIYLIIIYLHCNTIYELQKNNLILYFKVLYYPWKARLDSLKNYFSSSNNLICV